MLKVVLYMSLCPRLLLVADVKASAYVGARSWAVGNFFFDVVLLL